MAFPDFCDHDDPLRLSRPKQRWRDQNIATHIWYVQTLATKSCYFQTFATEKLRRDFRDRKTTARLSRPRRIWRDPEGQEMAWPARPNLAISRLSRTRWRRRYFPDQHGEGATLKKFFRDFSTMVDTVRLRKRRDSKGNGATVWPARPKCALSRLSRQCALFNVKKIARRFC